MSRQYTVAEGDFKSLKLGEGELEMLEDAYQAVSKINNGWEYLRRADVPGKRPCPHCSSLQRGICNGGNNGSCWCKGVCRICNGKGEYEQGFMFNDAEELSKINFLMKYDGHSGASYGWTMRNMEAIAKLGWDGYVAKKGIKPKPITSSLEDFANSLENNSMARAVIPNFDEQIAGIRRYDQAVKDAKKDPSTWKQSAGFPYPCPCHKAEGKEGWCGVAGFGVPACEH